MSDPSILASTLVVTLKENLLSADKEKIIAAKGSDVILVLSTLAEAVIVSSGMSLSEKLASIDGLNVEIISALSDVYGAALQATDIAGVAVRDIETQRLTRNQVIDTVIENKGVINGVDLVKSTTVNRKLSVKAGRIFMGGREYPVSAQNNAISIAGNSTSSEGTVIVYAYNNNGVIAFNATALNGSIPDGALEIGRVTVPAGKTSSNDQYLASSTLTDTSRREPGWPQVQISAGQTYVALNREFPDAEYMVEVEVSSATSFHQLGQVAATNKTRNGFLLVTTGTADDITCRCHVKYPSLK